MPPRASKKRGRSESQVSKADTRSAKKQQTEKPIMVANGSEDEQAPLPAKKGARKGTLASSRKTHSTATNEESAESSKPKLGSEKVNGKIDGQMGDTVLIDLSRDVIKRPILHPRSLPRLFASGDVYIEIVKGSSRNIYRLPTYVLCHASPWFRRTLATNVIEADVELSDEFVHQTGVEARYELTQEHHCDHPVLKRVSLTMYKSEPPSRATQSIEPHAQATTMRGESENNSPPQAEMQDRDRHLPKEATLLVSARKADLKSQHGASSENSLQTMIGQEIRGPRAQKSEAAAKKNSKTQATKPQAESIAKKLGAPSGSSRVHADPNTSAVNEEAIATPEAATKNRVHSPLSSMHGDSQGPKQVQRQQPTGAITPENISTSPQDMTSQIHHEDQAGMIPEIEVEEAANSPGLDSEKTTHVAEQQVEALAIVACSEDTTLPSNEPRDISAANIEVIETPGDSDPDVKFEEVTTQISSISENQSAPRDDLVKPAEKLEGNLNQSPPIAEPQFESVPEDTRMGDFATQTEIKSEENTTLMLSAIEPSTNHLPTAALSALAPAEVKSEENTALEATITEHNRNVPTEAAVALPEDNKKPPLFGAEPQRVAPDAVEIDIEGQPASQPLGVAHNIDPPQNSSSVGITDLSNEASQDDTPMISGDQPSIVPIVQGIVKAQLDGASNTKRKGTVTQDSSEKEFVTPPQSPQAKAEEVQGPEHKPAPVVQPEILEAYRSLFLCYCSQSPIISTTDIEQAVDQAELLTKIAKFYESLPVVRPHVSSALLSYYRNLHASIRQDPARFLLLSTDLQCAPIFKEAMIHIVAQSPCWNWSTPKNEMPEAVLKLIDIKTAELDMERIQVNNFLFQSCITKYNRRITLGAINDDTFDTWVVVQIWHDWFSRTLRDTALAKNSGEIVEGNMYRLMARGGEAYLSIGEVMSMLKPYRASQGSREWGKWDQKDVEEDLRIMKEYAARTVKKLVAHESMAAPGEVEYLTCVKVDEHELPWVAEAAGGE